MEDKVLKCKDCGAEFVFTAGEQEFYAAKGFQNEPVRCRDCRSKRRQAAADRPPREMYEVTCDSCGQPTQVPFKPRYNRPVYCRECFGKQQSQYV